MNFIFISTIFNFNSIFPHAKVASTVPQKSVGTRTDLPYWAPAQRLLQKLNVILGWWKILNIEFGHWMMMSSDQKVIFRATMTTYWPVHLITIEKPILSGMTCHRLHYIILGRRIKCSTSTIWSTQLKCSVQGMH